MCLGDCIATGDESYTVEQIFNSSAAGFEAYTIEPAYALKPGIWEVEISISNTGSAVASPTSWSFGNPIIGQTANGPPNEPNTPIEDFDSSLTFPVNTTDPDSTASVNTRICYCPQFRFRWAPLILWAAAQSGREITVTLTCTRLGDKCDAFP